MGEGGATGTPRTSWSARAWRRTRRPAGTSGSASTGPAESLITRGGAPLTGITVASGGHVSGFGRGLRRAHGLPDRRADAGRRARHRGTTHGRQRLSAGVRRPPVPRPPKTSHRPKTH